jgi:ribonuclease P protein component
VFETANFFHLLLRNLREANVPTEQRQSEKNARLSETHEHEGGADRSFPQTAKGPEADRRQHRLQVTRFRPQDRITKSADFKLCQNEGRRYSGRRLLLLRRDARGPKARLGVVITRKTGPAVTRNRWKRIIRDIFRLHRELLGSPADHVVIVRGSIRGKPTREDRAELLRLFQKAGSA